MRLMVTVRGVARAGRRFKRGQNRSDASRPAAGGQPRRDGTGASPASNGRPTPAGHRRGADRGPLVRDVSAGGVVYRKRPDAEQVEVALVGRLRPKRWALPKGTPEVGETLEG